MRQIKQGKILIVEDNSPLREVLSACFKGEGFSVICAHDAETGLQKAAKELPRLILLDMIMPGMHGNEMVKQLRKIPACKDIPVIYLSNSSREEYTEELENADSKVLGFIDKTAISLRELVKLSSRKITKISE